MSSEAAQEILVRGARALAHSDTLRSSLEILLAAIAEELDVESAVNPAVAGLAEALRNPGHPIARTVGDPVPSFDVLPSVPGGPALRSHLPLTVTRDGSNTVLGVLALAHHRPLDAAPRRLVEAAADLAAVAVERDGAT